MKGCTRSVMASRGTRANDWAGADVGQERVVSLSGAVHLRRRGAGKLAAGGEGAAGGLRGADRGASGGGERHVCRGAARGAAAAVRCEADQGAGTAEGTPRVCAGGGDDAGVGASLRGAAVGCAGGPRAVPTAAGAVAG